MDVVNYSESLVEHHFSKENIFKMAWKLLQLQFWLLLLFFIFRLELQYWGCKRGNFFGLTQILQSLLNFLLLLSTPLL